MGKISNALKKVMEEREKQKELQKNQLLEKAATQETENQMQTPTESGKTISKSATTKEGTKGLKTDNAYVAKSKDDSGIDPRVVTYFDYSSAISEQYRILRTNIKSYLLKEAKSTKASTPKSLVSPKIITLSSSLHSEGKTVTSVNLAVALAKDIESKVLLVDSDLRNGVVHKLLNLESQPGLDQILLNGYDYSAALHPTLLKNLFVIPRGQIASNPSELLGSKKMRLLIERLRQEDFTYIIIDTPPILPFTDAQVVCSQTDATVLVVQANRAQAQAVMRAKELIQQAHGKFLGFVLTHTDYYIPDFHSYYYYYRYRNEQKD